MKYCSAVLCVMLLSLLCPVAQAQPREFDFYAYGPYTEGAPRPEQILGYPIGSRHSYHHQMEAYFAALSSAPAVRARIKLEQYGTSFEGRKLWLLFISSEENIARLEEIRKQVERLRDSRATTETSARRIAETTPAIAWMNYANDGNESAAFEAALQAAYQLAAGEDARTRQIRERLITIINPAHTADAHDRFVTWYNAIQQGATGNSDPNAAEHRGDWLMDSNDSHFHIDPNRDAYALTQVESQAIVRQIHRWNPQVFVDHHGNPPIFFFPPVALPINENFPESTRKWETAIGKNIAAEFDKFGWPYMNREVFDLFYPGYFDSYPTLNGATGMTFETDGGGSQGLRLERADKTISTLRGGTAKHFAGTLATLAATAEGKEQRLFDFYLFRKSGMEEAEREPLKQIVLVPGADRQRLAEFVALLMTHGIEVRQSGSGFSSARAHSYLDDKGAVARQFPAGSFVIPLAQPQKRLIKALLEPEARLNDAFVKEVMARKERNDKLGRNAGRESYGFYDVTAWSLPLTYGVEAWWTEDRAAEAHRAAAPVVTGGVEGGRATYGYIFRYDTNAAAKLLAQLFKEEFNLTVLRSPIKAGHESFGAGSILARAERNPPALHERIGALARATGVSVRALNSAWTEAGISFGSGTIDELRAPRVAIAMYEPAGGRAYGSLWFLFEQLLDYPFTPIRTNHLRNADLSRYDVIIFPDGGEGGYQDVLGTSGIARIKQWIDNGGVFIGIRGGAAFATRRGVEWTTARLVGREEPLPAGAAQAPAPASQEREPERTPGAILRADFNLAHFLTFGYGDCAAASACVGQEAVMHNSSYIFKPSKEGTHVVSYAKENPRLSGFVWADTEKRIGGTPYLIDETVGRGHVILFADDPNFRLVWLRLTRLFLNGVFFAPSLR
jgi:hypothetical protein